MIMGMNCSVGIIGFGRFGKLMARYLAADLNVWVYDPHIPSQEIDSSNIDSASLETVARTDVVILAVPISRLKEVLVQVRPLLKAKSLVIDVCSVKEYPIRWLQELLPDDVEILGTHPMFGPDSAAESLEGRKIALCPVRIATARFEKIRRYLDSKGLVTIETTPTDHDRQIAVSLALTHFIGRTLAGMGVQSQEIDTEGYKRLLRILEVVEHDSWQLFEDMHRYNPYAREARQLFAETICAIEEKLG
jgi:prephenate dehydrogenase